MLPKKIRKRDPKYLVWIRSLPVCIGCGLELPVEAHHVPPKGGGKVGSKTDDSRAVPTCRSCHCDYHQYGRDKFEVNWILDLEAAIDNLNKRYIRLHPATATVRKERKRPMKVRVHVLNCSACGRTHELPWTKAKGGRFTCVNKNERVAVV